MILMRTYEKERMEYTKCLHLLARMETDLFFLVLSFGFAFLSLSPIFDQRQIHSMTV